MNMTFKLAVVAASAALLLGGCSLTATQTKIDTALTDGLPTVCSGLSVAHIAFTTIAATGKVKASVVTKENAAYAGIAVICSDPSSFTTSTALVKVAQAYSAISASLAEAKAATN